MTPAQRREVDTEVPPVTKKLLQLITAGNGRSVFSSTVSLDRSATIEGRSLG